MRYKFDNIAFNITEKRDPVPEDRLTYVGLEHMDSGSLYINRYGLDVELKGSKLVMHKGDILLGKRNAYLRRAAIAPHDGLFSAHGMVLRPKENVIDKNFFPFFVASDKFFDEVIRISVGGLSPTVNWKDLKELVFNLPPLAEQKVLAEKLWAAYRLKESYKKLLAATEEMVKSQFIEMFGDPVTNPKNWEKIPINDLCLKITDGTHKTPIYQDDGIVILSAKNIKNGNFDYKDVKYISYEEYLFLDKRCTPRKNDIVITKSGSIGDCAILDADFPVAFFESLALLKIKDRISPLFFKYVFKNKYLHNEIMSRCIKVLAIKHLHLEELKKIEIIVPPLEQQIQFTTIVRQADKSGFELRKSIDAIDKVIKSLINEN